jgi:hypothetical protein
MKFLFVFSHVIFFLRITRQVNFIEYYLLSGNTFVENVAVEIGANSTNFS